MNIALIGNCNFPITSYGSQNLQRKKETSLKTGLSVSDPKIIAFGDKRLGHTLKANILNGRNIYFGKAGSEEFIEQSIPKKQVNNLVCTMLEKTNPENKIRITHNELQQILSETGDPRKKLEFTPAELRKLLSEVKPDSQRSQTTLRKLDKTLLNILHGIDPETERHSKAIEMLSLILAKSIGINDKKVLAELELGADCHDIGKCKYHPVFFDNAKNLDELSEIARLPKSEVLSQVRAHTITGVDILESSIPLLNRENKVLQIVGNHHETESGHGYNKKSGKDLSVEEKIIIIADAVAAASSRKIRRDQKEGFKSNQEMIEDLKQNSKPNPERGGMQQFDQKYANEMIKLINKNPDLLNNIKEFVLGCKTEKETRKYCSEVKLS